MACGLELACGIPSSNPQCCFWVLSISVCYPGPYNSNDRLPWKLVSNIAGVSNRESNTWDVPDRSPCMGPGTQAACDACPNWSRTHAVHGGCNPDHSTCQIQYPWRTLQPVPNCTVCGTHSGWSKTWATWGACFSQSKGPRLAEVGIMCSTVPDWPKEVPWALNLAWMHPVCPLESALLWSSNLWTGPIPLAWSWWPDEFWHRCYTWKKKTAFRIRATRVC